MSVIQAWWIFIVKNIFMRPQNIFIDNIFTMEKFPVMMSLMKVQAVTANMFCCTGQSASTKLFAQKFLKQKYSFMKISLPMVYCVKLLLLLFIKKLCTFQSPCYALHKWLRAHDIYNHMRKVKWISWHKYKVMTDAH